MTFDITVTNQGDLDAYGVEVTDYIPTGFTLADTLWTASGTNAVYTLPATLATNTSVVVPLTLMVDASFTGDELVNYAEISKADNDTDPNNTPLPDVDSTPDSDDSNDAG